MMDKSNRDSVDKDIESLLCGESAAIADKVDLTPLGSDNSSVFYGTASPE